jgi:hypothetical protein
MKRNEIIAYDISALFSYSPGINMAEFDYNNSDLTPPVIKLILGFLRSETNPATSVPIPDRLRTSIR